MSKLYLRQRSDSNASGLWTAREHELFLEGIAQYPRGPWRAIADHVGSRNIKQVQTHAQKYQQKLLRRQRGLRKNKIQPSRAEHRLDEKTAEQFTNGAIMRKYQPAHWVHEATTLPKALKLINPVLFHQPPAPVDWSLPDVELHMEILDVRTL
ncbi:hypothetical protein Poli38472_004765 [Pythium oligandrum]|uniref:Uncharacterized protein n=1 Tax=Pythium oligandrum TaxID=41045 RepID=A0A8K1CB30_PYTOL|nr:hypothetical protein Poli38472_004765 [Pythium oligandrum]|eukprot:TMW59696.1 hypothetical protein Poli38472_004765 [Pythium oligandrum]